jgi:hypothetical protein
MHGSGVQPVRKEAACGSHESTQMCPANSGGGGHARYSTAPTCCAGPAEGCIDHSTAPTHKGGAFTPPALWCLKCRSHFLHPMGSSPVARWHARSSLLAVPQAPGSLSSPVGWLAVGSVPQPHLRLPCCSPFPGFPWPGGARGFLALVTCLLLCARVVNPVPG